MADHENPPAPAGRPGGQLNARHQAMADLLVDRGYAVLFPDSLTPRGLAEICTQKIGSRTVTQTQRRADTLAALEWVARQPWAAGRKSVLLGWSHGGSAVLASTDATRADVRGVAPPAAAVAFYPGCTAALQSGWKPTTRVVVMIGEKDDWTPADPCIALGQRSGIEVNVYPDSYHDFDNPVGEVRLRREVPNGVHPGQGVHAGRNPVAREQAYARLWQVLEAAFNPAGSPGSSR
ncbi:dienelactone hydrolase family protein [Ramlibacter sp. G-1-2-2]|uniref:Dienelactone hydrolase family protein n=1 Tax=Ramlibacter agri TaxID=2728837 RepID=A0A848HCR6_9BURK|nr:dienelactone hydrolase family protein [Ramlibacter agri]NML48535.1 dienelactone hydrolase family protein [Ramlibacter agri]